MHLNNRFAYLYIIRDLSTSTSSYTSLVTNPLCLSTDCSFTHIWAVCAFDTHMFYLSPVLHIALTSQWIIHTFQHSPILKRSVLRAYAVIRSVQAHHSTIFLASVLILYHSAQSALFTQKSWWLYLFNLLCRLFNSGLPAGVDLCHVIVGISQDSSTILT